MKRKVLSLIEALDLSDRAEDHFFDKKALGLSGAKVQKIAVAFANADGGEFVIGIDDDRSEQDPNRRWKGAASIEEFNSH